MYAAFRHAKPFAKYNASSARAKTFEEVKEARVKAIATTAENAKATIEATATVLESHAGESLGRIDAYTQQTMRARFLEGGMRNVANKPRSYTVQNILRNIVDFIVPYVITCMQVQNAMHSARNNSLFGARA